MDDFDDIQIEEVVNEDAWDDEMREMQLREMMHRNGVFDWDSQDDHTPEDDRDWSNGNPDSMIDFDELDCE